MNVNQADGSVKDEVQLTARKLKYQRQRVTATAVIAAGGSSTISIFATPGYIARLKYFGAYSPAIPAATTGTNSITLGIGNTGYGADQITVGSGANGAVVTVKYDSPSTISFDASNPLQILFTNTTDKPTDGVTARLYTVIYEEEAII